MKKGRFLKQMTAYVLAFCMLVLGMFNENLGIVQAAGISRAGEGTTVYFYNVKGWENVYAYGFENDQPVDGNWPGTQMEAAADVGEGWYKATIQSGSDFNLIVNDGVGGDGRQLDAGRITKDTTDNYLTGDKTVYHSKAEAEKALGLGGGTVDPGTPDDPNGTTVYFYNVKGWENVYVYGFANDQPVDGNWPGTQMEVAADVGEGWYKATIHSNVDFSLIVNDGVGGDGRQLDAGNIAKDTTDNYLTGDKTVYHSKAEAEKALGLGGGTVDPGTPDDPNGTTVYFYNIQKWATVSVHAWNDDGNLTGDWGTTKASASSIGDNWMEVKIPSKKGFSIIFFNSDKDSERATTYLSGNAVYATVIDDGAYTSKEATEEAIKNLPTTIYFVNSENWTEVQVSTDLDATVYTCKKERDVPEDGPKKGELWSVEIPKNALLENFKVTFSDKNDDTKKTPDVEIKDYKNNYVVVDGTVYSSVGDALKSLGVDVATTVYYLNNEGWERVSAYVYGEPGEVFGGYPGKELEKASGLGENWLKIVVPALPPFSIIINDPSDTTETVRATTEIKSNEQVYAVGSQKAGTQGFYGSKEAAEAAVGLGDPSQMTTVYFYNSLNWKTVNCYVYTEDENGNGTAFGAGWPGAKAKSAEAEVGEKWWKFDVPISDPQNNPFNVIFNDGVNQTDGILISDKETVYAIMPGVAFTNKDDAENEAPIADEDDGDDENEDLYEIAYSGAGAELPYITYEAEAATRSEGVEVLEKSTAFSKDIQSEASGRQAVKLEKQGDSVEFTLTKPANAFVLRYSIPDSADGAGIDAKLSMYIDEADKGDLELTSKYAWVYGAYPYGNTPNSDTDPRTGPHRYFDETRTLLGETLPVGTKIKLQKDAGDTAANYIIDFIECELVDPALTQPEGSLSVTEYGAVADDGKDDFEAFQECMNAAKEKGKEVWIPAGTFDLVERKALDADAVTIRGAGMWYTNLKGEGAAFKYKGRSKFYDFAMTGVTTSRRDSIDLAGFEGSGSATNVTIQNIWMEHMKVGIWSANTKNLVVQGCRIRNTYADGINLCSGTNYATVRNNNVRNTGDDCIAIWPWLADCSFNTIEHNTVQTPDLANGIAVYGGENNKVLDNHVSDIRSNGSGICLGTDYDTPNKDTPNTFSGATEVKNNVLERCGSWHKDYSYPIGAIWIWATKASMTAEFEIQNNKLIDCSYEGILIDGYNKISGLEISYNDIEGATDAVFVRGEQEGEANIGNITGTYSGKLVNSENSNFKTNVQDKDGYLVIFNSNGGTKVDSVVVEKDQRVTKPNDPVRDGYTFAGWYLNNEEYDFDQQVTGNITLIAKWTEKTKYEVTFDSQGGTEVATKSVRDGQRVSKPKNPVKDGYIFVAWYLDDEEYDFSQPVTQNITLTAKWRVKETYTVTFDSQGGTEVASATVTEGERVAVPEEPLKDGYRFVGWYLDGKKYNFSQPVTGNITLVAEWQNLDPNIEYTVTFDSQNGTPIISVQVKNGEFVEKPTTPEKEGYTFIGWYLKGTNTEYKFDEPVIKNIELEARWESTNPDQEFTVTFDSQGGTEIAPVKVKNGECVTAPATPEKKGYEFKGWYLNGEKYNFDAPVTEDITLEAKWEKSTGSETNPGETDSEDEGILEGDMPEDGKVPDGLWIAGVKDQTYTGKAIKPEVRVYDHDIRLKAGRDYTISYKNNTKVNKDTSKAPTITVKGKGNYTKSATAAFNILPVDLESASISVADEITVAYNSKKTQKVVPTVTFNGKKLANKRDFTVSYPDEQRAGAYKDVSEEPYTIVLNGTGNFTGTKSVNLVITDKTLIEKAKVGKVPDKTYNGNEITLSESDLVVKYKNNPLVLNTDYEISGYESNTEIGTAAVIIKGKGKYAGTKRITFKITGTSLKGVQVDGIVDKVYNGSAQYQDNMTVKSGNEKLTEDKDYTVTYDKAPINVGTVRMTIQGIGKYTGTVRKTYRITACDLQAEAAKENSRLTGIPKDLTVKYVKGGCKPEVTLKFGDKELVNGTDYKISYSKNTNLTTGYTAVITIQGKGNFKGKVTASFAIVAKSLEDEDSPVTMTVADVAFVDKKGKYISKPVLTDCDGKVLKAGTDYDKAVVYELVNADGTFTTLDKNSKVEAGKEVRVTVTGKGKYTGTLTETYRVTTNSFSKAKITIPEQTYKGKAIELKKEDITVKVGTTTLSPEQYDIISGSYVNNIKKGTASVKIKGLGEYGGTKTVKFKIKAQEMTTLLNIAKAVKNNLGLQ